MEAEVLLKIFERVNAGQKACMLVLTKNKGSAPGKEGAVMAVFSDDTQFGTIGGGSVEYALVKRAKDAMKRNEDFQFDYDLSEKGELKMSCGGQSEGYGKVFYPKSQLIIFGAGHCAQKIARIATLTNFEVIITDDREQFRQAEDFHHIKDYLVGTPKEVIDKLSFHADNTYVLCATRGHRHDREAAALVLQREYKYLGILGSKRKALNVKQFLLDQGCDKEKVDAIYLPVGLDVDDGSVEEIAISVLSEILKVKNGKEGLSNRIKSR